MTALMFAVKVGSLDVVKLLAEKSTELFAMNSVSMNIRILYYVWTQINSSLAGIMYTVER